MHTEMSSRITDWPTDQIIYILDTGLLSFQLSILKFIRENQEFNGRVDISNLIVALVLKMILNFVSGVHRYISDRAHAATTSRR